jgi:hypothetical protein
MPLTLKVLKAGHYFPFEGTFMSPEFLQIHFEVSWGKRVSDALRVPCRIKMVGISRR